MAGIATGSVRSTQKVLQSQIVVPATVFRIHCKFWCLQLSTLDLGKTRHASVVPVLSGDRLWMCHHCEELIRSISFSKLDFYKDE
jgi:hypothetical protein